MKNEIKNVLIGLAVFVLGAALLGAGLFGVGWVLWWAGIVDVDIPEIIGDGFLFVFLRYAVIGFVGILLLLCTAGVCLLIVLSLSGLGEYASKYISKKYSYFSKKHHKQW